MMTMTGGRASTSPPRLSWDPDIWWLFPIAGNHAASTKSAATFTAAA